MNWGIILAIGSIALFVIILVILLVIATNRDKKIMNEGIEAHSIVCRVEKKWKDGRSYYNAYVKYIGDDNLEHEALLSAKINFPYGRKIKIKYLPPKYDYAVFLSQELEQGEKNEL